MEENIPARQTRYPFNLLCAIAHNTRLALPVNFTRDHFAGLQYALFTLPSESQKWVHLQFEQELSQEEICLVLHLTVQETDALAAHTTRKLRLLSRWNWICYGIEGNAKRLREQARADGYLQGYQRDLEIGKSGKSLDSAKLTLPLLSLPLSTRIYNVLMRAGFSTLGEVAALTACQIAGIPGLGKKNAKTLARVLLDFGVSGTAWDRFLRP